MIFIQAGVISQSSIRSTQQVGLKEAIIMNSEDIKPSCRGGLWRAQLVSDTNNSESESVSCGGLSSTPWTIPHQVPLSVGFSRQEDWSGLLFRSPGSLPDPGIEPGSPALQADSLLSEQPGKPKPKSKIPLQQRVGKAIYPLLKKQMLTFSFIST